MRALVVALLLTVGCKRTPRAEPITQDPPRPASTAPTRAPTGEIEVSVLAAEGGFYQTPPPEPLQPCRTSPMIGWVVYETAFTEDGSAKSAVVLERNGIPEATASCMAAKVKILPPAEGYAKHLVYVALR